MTPITLITIGLPLWVAVSLVVGIVIGRAIHHGSAE